MNYNLVFLLLGLFIFTSPKLTSGAQGQHSTHNVCTHPQHITSSETEEIINLLGSDPNLVILNTDHHNLEINKVEAIKIEDIHLYHSAFSQIERFHGDVGSSIAVYQADGMIESNLSGRGCSSFSCWSCTDDGKICADCFYNGETIRCVILLN